MLTHVIGTRPVCQFIGLDNDDITLFGSLYSKLTGGKTSLVTLELMAESGKAWSFLDGDGNIYGMFIIEEISQSKSYFFANGAARKIEFTLKLKPADSSLSAVFGDLSQQLAAILL